MTIKKISPNKLNSSDGWRFGLGFFAAGFIFTMIIIPASFCTILILLALLGDYVSRFLP